MSVQKRRFIVLVVVGACLLAGIIISWRRASLPAYPPLRLVEKWSREAAGGDQQAVGGLKGLGPQAVPALCRLLERKDSFWHERAWAIAAKMPSKWQNLIYPKLRPPNAVSAREAAARSLGLLGPDALAAVPALVHAMRDKEWRVFWASVTALRSIGTKALPALIEGLHHRDANMRRYAAYALGQWGPVAEPAVPALIPLLGDRHEQVRSATADCLAAIGPHALPAVVAALHDAKPAVRKGATNAYARFNTSVGVMASLIQLARDDAPEWRRQAVASLGGLPMTNGLATRALAGALSDPVDDVRLEAARSLARFGGRAQFAVPKLTECLKDGCVGVREWSARSLGNIGPPAKPAVPELLRLAGDSEESVRVAALEAVKKIEPTQPVENHP